MNAFSRSMTLILISIITPSLLISAEALDRKAEQALKFSAQQLKKSVAEIGDPSQMARTTQPDGSWTTVKAGDWTSGFFPGLLWFASEFSDPSSFRKAAEDRTSRLEGQKNNAGDHDVGFRIMCSYGNGYRITKNPAYR